MKKIAFLLIAVIAVIMVSCGKYEEGPSFSLLPKKSRVVNVWKVEKTIYKVGSSTTENAGDDNVSIEFKSDDTYVSTWTNGSTSLSTKGTWNFDSKKENIEMQEDGSSTKNISKIIMLKSNEMWLSQTNGNTTSEVHYVTK